MPPKSEQPEYPYQNIRTKNFFWGDGDKVSPFLSGRHVAEYRTDRLLGTIMTNMTLSFSQTLFWNDNVNYHKKSEE